MMKAIGTAVLNFAGVAAVWTALELIYTSITAGDFVSNLTHPLFLIPCVTAAGIVAGFSFLSAKSRTAHPVNVR